MSEFNQIPTLDLNDYRSNDPVKRQKFINDLGKAYETIGFAAIKNHNLSEELQEDLYASSKEFFYSEKDLKNKYYEPKLCGQRGYIPANIEKAVGQKHPDLKEFYQMGNEKYGKNIFPSEYENFEKSTTQAFNTLESTGMEMLSAISEFLGLDKNHLTNMCDNGNSIMRLLHYFPIINPEESVGKVRAGAHGDINFITLLMGASADGLEVLRNDGKWIPVTKVDDCVVVNIGDMLERYTNGRLKSTIHRVVNPTNPDKMKTSRFSIPFFVHARPEVSLNCLKSCFSDENPIQFETITAGEFLDERLKDLGLKA